MDWWWPRARVEVKRKWGLTAHGYGVSFWGEKMF